MFLCFICDEKRKVKKAKPAPGTCGRCGGGASKVRVRSIYRFCFIPVCCTFNKQVMCSRCGAHLRSY